MFRNVHPYGMLLSGSLLLSASAQTAKLDIRAEESRLIAVERMWNEAQVHQDSGALANMIGDKFVSTEYNGEVSDRGKFLGDIADPKFKPSENDNQGCQGDHLRRSRRGDRNLPHQGYVQFKAVPAHWHLPTLGCSPLESGNASPAIAVLIQP